MSELGPISKALLDVVEESFGYITISEVVTEATKRSRWHSGEWWFRRLVALNIEDYIEAKVYRNGDQIAIKFRRKMEEKKHE